MPTVPLPPTYRMERAHVHFLSRATLVMEEARCTIAQSLASIWNKTNGDTKGDDRGHNDKRTFVVNAVNAEKKTQWTGHVKVTFVQFLFNPLSQEQMNQIRFATVFQWLSEDDHPSLENVILGFVTNATLKPGFRDCESGEGDHVTVPPQVQRFSMYWFRNIPDKIEDIMKTRWILTPVSTLISEPRSFEALTRSSVLSVPFLFDLLGHRGKEPHPQLKTERYIGLCTPPDSKSDTRARLSTLTTSPQSVMRSLFSNSTPIDQHFCFPMLNKTQQNAADTFLYWRRLWLWNECRGFGISHPLFFNVPLFGPFSQGRQHFWSRSFVAICLNMLH